MPGTIANRKMGISFGLAGLDNKHIIHPSKKKKKFSCFTCSYSFQHNASHVMIILEVSVWEDSQKFNQSKGQLVTE
jgi:ribosomal protein L31